MITCYIDYTIDPNKENDFVIYAKKWIHLVKQFGGNHHGYFLPCEGANNKAYALFSFPSLADYEQYRKKSLNDKSCQDLYAFAKKRKFILSYQRNFLKPIINSIDNE